MKMNHFQLLLVILVLIDTQPALSPLPRADAVQVFQVHYQRFGVVTDGHDNNMLQQGQAAARPHRLGLPPLLHTGP